MGYYIYSCSLYKSNLFVMLQVLYSVMGENHKGNASSDPLVHFSGGGLAGITAASAAYPLDLVRTRLAAQVIRNYTWL